MSDRVVFPPLLAGVTVSGSADPMAQACALARRGCDGGTVVYNAQADRLRTAIVFAPEVALEQAMVMLVACGIGFQNALGALAPPEVGVHLTWNGTILLNGARCGQFRVAASDRDGAEVPGWLVVGLEVTLIQTGENPGEMPDVTSLYDEGCAEIAAEPLLEAWARHTLVWINRWSQEGNAPLHAEWTGLVQGIGETVNRNGITGTFLGVDDQFGMLIRDATTTRLIPLGTLLEDIS